MTYTVKGSRERHKSLFDLDMIIDIKGWKATGNKLSSYRVQKVVFINPEGTSSKKIKASEVKKAIEMSKKELKEVETAKADSSSNKENVKPTLQETIEEEPKPLPITKKEPPKGESGGGYNVGDTIELFSSVFCRM